MATRVSSRAAACKPSADGNGDRPLCDSHWNLWLQLNWQDNGTADPLETLGLTSCYRREGVSTVAAQMAVEAAASGRYRVLLVDANLAFPSAHRIFKVKPTPGLADCLASGEDPADCFQDTGDGRLSILPAGDTRNADLGLYPAEGLEQLVKSLKSDFDLVVFDMPAVGQRGPVIRLAGLLDGVVLVVEAQRVRAEVAGRITGQLSRANVRLLGAVLNKQVRYVPK